MPFEFDSSFNASLPKPTEEQQLLAEAGGMFANDFPEQSRFALVNPLISDYKTPTRYLNDQRRAYVLERLGGESPEYLEQLRASYSTEPLLDSSMPIGGALNWAQSAPSAVYGVGQSLANQTDKAVSAVLGQESVTPYPDAMQNAARSAYNLVEPIAGAGEVADYYLFGNEVSSGRGGDDYIPGEEARKLERKDQKASVPFTNLYPEEEYAKFDEELEDGNPIIEGVEYLDQAKIPELDNTTAGYVTKRVLGTLMDGSMDPFGPLGFARAWGQPLAKGLTSLAYDFGPDALVEVGLSSADYIRRLREEQEQSEAQNR